MLIVIPAYNEERHLGEVIASVPEYVDTIVVVDDCSQDETPRVIESLKDDRLISLQTDRNRGVGGATLLGYAKAQELDCDIVVKMDGDGQIQEAHSISAGLDYPGIGPEHAWLNDIKRVKYLSATDKEALAAFQLCSRLEGIIPALEPAHALARVADLAPKKPKDHLMVVNLSGRGDKDLASVADYLERHGGWSRL